MLTDQMDKPMTLEKVTEKFSSVADTNLPVCISAGDTCSPHQDGYETTDSEKRILKCTKVNEYEYQWQDTGRVQS